MAASGLVVADVTGHGLAASLLACETRALIRAAAASTASIAEIATRTNAQLHRDLHHERFVVLFLAALEAATNRLEFVGAGCAPIVYRQAESRFIQTEATVPPLGVAAGAARTHRDGTDPPWWRHRRYAYRRPL